MKKIFYIGLTGLGLFEILNVYFIMPMPGSQQLDSIDVAYFLYIYRWFIRIAFAIMIAVGSVKAFQVRRKWIPALAIIPVMVIIYIFNFKMTADHMFLQPEKLVFKPRSENTLSDSSLVIVVSNGAEARAYPVRYILYHHQVRDTIGGKPVMVTYCNVCRTGRVYEPVVNGKPESFRLVGMDHFNAMFEDKTTTSWWRQATGEAVTGTLKGNLLPVIECSQVTVGKFFNLYPFGTIMQPEDVSTDYYDTLGRFESGRSKGQLTRTDSLSWKDKSWVVGIEIGGKTKAYDWTELKEMRITHDSLGGTPLVIAVSADEKSFNAFQRDAGERFQIRNDSLISEKGAYDFVGRGADRAQLTKLKAYQEFWHSWKTFNPETEVYEK